MKTTFQTPAHQVSDIEVNISISSGSTAPTDSAAPGPSYEHVSKDVPDFGPKLTPHNAMYIIHEMAFEFLDKNCDETSPHMEANVNELVLAVIEMYENKK